MGLLNIEINERCHEGSEVPQLVGFFLQSLGLESHLHYMGFSLVWHWYPTGTLVSSGIQRYAIRLTCFSKLPVAYETVFGCLCGCVLCDGLKSHPRCTGLNGFEIHICIQKVMVSNPMISRVRVMVSFCPWARLKTLAVPGMVEPGRHWSVTSDAGRRCTQHT